MPNRTLSTGLVVVAVVAVAAPLRAQTHPFPTLAPQATLEGARPVPGPVYESEPFTRAVERGTRTRTGRPGPGYWVEHPRYTIDARFDPRADRVSGSEVVAYRNESPDTLRRLAVMLRQNAFAAGSPRRDAAPVTGGVSLRTVVVDGQPISSARRGGEDVPITDVALHHAAARGYTVDGTVLWIPLARPLPPRDSVRLEFAWAYSPPPAPADGREGREGDIAYMGYWYPQMAVYDDVNGWVADPYLLQAEFYMDPADYDVRLTVPRGWVVDATGTLANPREVLSPRTLARLARARRTGDVVRVLTPGVDAAGAFAGSGPTSTWHFVARDVRDFAWGTSDQWAWDATRALVRRPPARAGGSAAAPHGRGAGAVPFDTVDIHSFFRLYAPAAAWALDGARFTRNAIERLSEYLWPYPWPKMTSMEGVLDSGGMEYPMMTLMQPWADTLSLAGDLMHETGHMWFPMQVGASETRFPWMDEGFTQFDAAQGLRAQYGSHRIGGREGDSEAGQRALYLAVVRAGQDRRLMWPGDLYPQDVYFTLFYDKTAQVLAALRGVLGEETFHRALREYGERWTGRHPYPADFFNTVSDVAGRDLDWFWQTWFYHAWPLDQAVGAVEPAGDSVAITIEDRGLAPMPVPLAITRADGSVQRLEVPATVWLTGARRHVVRLAAAPAIVRVEIDPQQLFPDVDRGNNVWVRSGPRATVR